MLSVPIPNAESVQGDAGAVCERSWVSRAGAAMATRMCSIEGEDVGLQPGGIRGDREDQNSKTLVTHCDIYPDSLNLALFLNPDIVS